MIHSNFHPGDLALHGHRVKMYDSDIVILNSVCERIKEDKNELIREGLLAQSVFSVSCMLLGLKYWLKSVISIHIRNVDIFDMTSSVFSSVEPREIPFDLELLLWRMFIDVYFMSALIYWFLQIPQWNIE